VLQAFLNGFFYRMRCIMLYIHFYAASGSWTAAQSWKNLHATHGDRKKYAVHPSQEALWIAGRKPDVFYVRKTVAWRQWSMMAE
jgi:hypothetical protein